MARAATTAMAVGIGPMPEFLDVAAWPSWMVAAAFVIGAIAIWLIGTRVVRLVDELSRRTGMGQGFAGMLLLGGIVSLTEISTVSTAAFTGSPVLALNNLLGSESINLFLLASIDPLSGRDAMTSFIAKPSILLQATLVMLLLTVVVAAMTVGDHLVFGIGIWASALFLLCLGALWMSARYEKRRAWVPSSRESAKERSREENDEQRPPSGSLRWLIAKLAVFAAALFAAGFVLSLAGEALADKTGLGASFIGFVLVGTSTSLPELSTIAAAVRLKRHEMAVGDILGSNLFNLLLILLADVVFVGDPVLNHTGRFEMVAALLGIAMTGILLLGLLERRDKTLFGMGYDSAAMVAVFVGGLLLLYTLSGVQAPGG